MMFRSITRRCTVSGRSQPAVTPLAFLNHDGPTVSFGTADWPVSPACHIPEHIIRPLYARIPGGVVPQRNLPEGKIYNKETLKIIRQCGQLIASTRELLLSKVRAGITMEDLDRVAHEFIVANDAYPSGVNFWGFPKAICASVNEIAVHGIPNSRPLQRGDVVKMDVTLFQNGFYGDTCCSIVVEDGESSVTNAEMEQRRELVAVSKEALWEGIRAVGPGAPLSAVSQAIQSYAAKHGYDIVREFHGHFIGEEMHMRPMVPGFVYPKHSDEAQYYDNFKLRPGHVFTIEPILTKGDRRVVTHKDGWSMSSVDGSYAAQWEHMVTVTEDGQEVLTRVPDNDQLWKNHKTHLD